MLISLSLLAACGGGDDDCGVGGAPSVGLVAKSAAAPATLTFGGLHAGLNNDCPAADAPSGVISLTLQGTQTDGTGNVTLCIARPDLLAERAQALGHDQAGVAVRLVDVNGTANNCSFAIDVAQPVTGTVTTSGLCGDGGDPAGFALVVDGALHLQRTCNTVVDSLDVTLRGRVAVQADQAR
ncbi:MAG TPA: hypothetical protein VFP84_01000 [Kofleriaceae bacterium]|nr:hypothetical protein [Kofleriaceae bacterium]